MSKALCINDFLVGFITFKDGIVFQRPIVPPTMKLLYVWIDEYYVLKERGFSFSDEYLVSEEVIVVELPDSRPLKDVKITIAKNENFIPGFFSGNISCVTAIVGENGVGKSTLVDFILGFIHNPDIVGGSCALFWSQREEQFVLATASGGPSAIPIRFTLGPAGIQSSTVRTKTKKLDLNEKYIPPVCSIFYNPALDLRDYGRPLGEPFLGFADVSTNFLIWEDNHQYYEDEVDQVEKHRFQNVRRQFALAESEIISRQELAIPSEIEVRFNKDTRADSTDLGSRARDEYERLTEIARDALGEANDAIEEAEQSSEESYVWRAKLAKVKVWFLKNLVDNFFYSLSRQKDLKDTFFSSFIPGEYEMKYEPRVRHLFQQQTFLPNEKFDVDSFIDLVFQTIDYDVVQHADVADNEAFFTIPVGKAQAMHEMHLRYISTMPSNSGVGFLDFDWRDLSSGEKAYFDLYARLFHGYQVLQDRLSPESTIYAFIDEGELGFHPQWQKEYLAKLIKFFSALTNLRVQLFVTSHSPFVLSDLPKSNVVLLGAQKNTSSDRSRQSKLTVKTQTFGANIHELFTDTFFIVNGTVGDFARSKILGLIDKLEGNDILDAAALEELKKTINLIGEPVIRDRLLDMYNEKYVNRESREERIARLRKELDDLEGQKAKNE